MHITWNQNWWWNWNSYCVGWLLEISGYVGTNATQPASAITMLQVIYLWLPFVFEILITILLSKMNVEAANEKLRREKGI